MIDALDWEASGLVNNQIIFSILGTLDMSTSRANFILNFVNCGWIILVFRIIIKVKRMI